MQPTTQSIGNRRRISGNVLIFLTSLLLLGSAAAKLAHVPKVVSQLASMGFDGDRLILVGVLEILSAVLFLWRPTRSMGLLLVSAFLGGAIATHIQHGHSAAQPAVFLALLWLGTWLRHPEILWSAIRGDAMSSPANARRGDRAISAA
jgi:hypothetical protein